MTDAEFERLKRFFCNPVCPAIINGSSREEMRSLNDRDCLKCAISFVRSFIKTNSGNLDNRCWDVCNLILLSNVDEAGWYYHVGEKLEEQHLHSQTRKEIKMATRMYSKTIEWDSSHIEAYRRRARAYKELGEKGLAQKDFEAVLRLKPNDEDAMANLRECF